MTNKPLAKPAVQVLPYAWVILAVVYLASVAAPLNQFKVPPIMPVLMEDLGIDLARAGSLMSVIALVGLILALPAGILLQRVGPRASGLLALGFILLAAMLIFPFQVSGWQITAVMVVQGIAAGAIATATFAAAPEVMRKPQWAGLGLAVILIGQNLGQLIGPVLLGELIGRVGWIAAGYALIPVCLLGLVSAWLVRVR